MNGTMLGEFSPTGSLSLYIHVPFCRTKCRYCGFYSHGRPASSVLNRFLAKLQEELAVVSHWRRRPFETAFIGGGNPGMLSFDGLLSIVDAVCESGRPGELTIEMNPESLTDGMQACFERGGTRLSMGVQSMDERSLAVLGRNATLGQTKDALRLVKSMRSATGFDLNVDVMTCIPGQSLAEAVSDIDRIVDFINPEHLSVYCLTVEEGTPLAADVAAGRVREMETDRQADMLFEIWHHLASLGYDHYEVSNFARRDQDSHLCLHNLRYWNLQPYLGIGPSACSTALAPDGLVRCNAEPDVHAYAAQTAFSTYQVEKLTKYEELEEYLIMSLRTRFGIDKQGFSRRFGCDFNDILSQSGLKGTSFDPLVNDTEERFWLSESGWMVMDPIVVRLASVPSIPNGSA